MTSAMIYQGLERGYAASDLETGAAVVDASNIDEVIEREKLWKDKGKEMGIGEQSSRQALRRAQERVSALGLPD